MESNNNTIISDENQTNPPQSVFKNIAVDTNLANIENKSESDESPSSSKPSPTRKPCMFFNNGTCRNGDKCRFSHDPPGNLSIISI
jgi:hypothetical protein